jgi:hypothetical protein
MSDKKSLQQAIAKEEERLSKLDREREQTLLRITDFKQQLASLEAGYAGSKEFSSTRTPLEI